jgi:hypothetical protein
VAQAGSTVMAYDTQQRTQLFRDGYAETADTALANKNPYKKTKTGK